MSSPPFAKWVELSKGEKKFKSVEYDIGCAPVVMGARGSLLTALSIFFNAFHCRCRLNESKVDRLKRRERERERKEKEEVVQTTSKRIGYCRRVWPGGGELWNVMGCLAVQSESGRDPTLEANNPWTTTARREKHVVFKLCSALTLAAAKCSSTKARSTPGVGVDGVHTGWV